MLALVLVVALSQAPADAPVVEAPPKLKFEPVKLDETKLWEIRVMRKGEPFPYGSGVAMDEATTVGKANEQRECRRERDALRRELVDAPMPVSFKVGVIVGFLAGVAVVGGIWLKFGTKGGGQ